MVDLMKVAELVRARRFAEAAAAARENAEFYRRTGHREEWVESLASAAKCLHLAGDAAGAVTQYTAVFALEDEQLRHMPSADLVMARLAHWPEMYARAALAAADAGDPVRAVELAEAGRFRLLGRQLGPARRPPRSAPAPLWAEYVHAWRRLAAASANRTLEAGAVRDPALALRVKEHRKALRKAGVPLEEMIPPVESGSLPGRLAELSDDTRILYSVVLDDTVRFLVLGRQEARPIDVPVDGQAALLRACRDSLTGVRAGQGDWRRHVQTLIDTTGPILGPVLEESLRGSGAGRLLWVPHGVLSAVPLAALPFESGALIDHAALLVSPSVRFGLAPAVTAPGGARAARGTAEGLTDTSGGDRLLRAYQADPPPDLEVMTLDELHAVARAVPLFHLTCHGEYDRASPLQSALLLGGGCRTTLESLIDGPELRPDQLVLLGACDAGTIAQAENNEALGIPTALLLAGAATVIGAQWPVWRPAAVGLCLKVLAELAGGAASPEAVQVAARWLRGLTAETFAAALGEVDHPLAGAIARSAARFEITPHDWAAFVHWGAAWTSSRSG